MNQDIDKIIKWHFSDKTMNLISTKKLYLEITNTIALVTHALVFNLVLCAAPDVRKTQRASIEPVFNRYRHRRSASVQAWKRTLYAKADSNILSVKGGILFKYSFKKIISVFHGTIEELFQHFLPSREHFPIHS